MRTLAITICGNRYEMSLNDELAQFVEENLQDSQMHLDQDNKADKLLQAYLKLAKQASQYESQLTEIADKLEI